MANFLDPYDPIFYAQEALRHMENNLGFAGRLHRGFDKAPQQRGSKIQVSRPSVFTTQAGTDATPQDLATSSIWITLSNHRKVEFLVSDVDVSHGGQSIIDDHIRPAGYALANYVDAQLAGLYTSVPWVLDATGVAANMTAARKVLRDNGVPLGEKDRMHFIIGSSYEEKLLNVTAFAQHQGAGLEGQELQREGDLARKYGFNIFPDQNVATHATVAITAASPTLKANIAPSVAPEDDVNAVETFIIEDTTMTGTLKKGDTFVIAGNAQRYVIQADVVCASNEATVTVLPRLATSYSLGDAVTFDQTDNAKTQNIAFHRNFACLAMAPLSDIGASLFGGRMVTIVDPNSGLAIRSSIWYDPLVGGNTKVRLDILFGFRVLDGNLAVRSRLA